VSWWGETPVPSLERKNPGNEQGHLTRTIVNATIQQEVYLLLSSTFAARY
jgi:hypothetical protein